MQPVLSRKQIQAFDRQASEGCSVPSLLLMENAGRGAAEIIVQWLAAHRPAGIREGRVRILCGPGNNGGDGFVVARRLLALGASPCVLLAARRDRLRGDALVNAEAWSGLGGRTVELSEDSVREVLDVELDGADVVVDALLGTGLERPVTGLFATVVDLVNRRGVPIVALDIPSGLDADRGTILGVAVRASLTVTFAHLKLGLLSPTAVDHTGEVRVVDIGVPPALVQSVGSSAWLVECADVAGWLPTRPRSAHKGIAGRVLAVAGSPGKIGAALLVGRGALRAGAGLVTLASFPEAAQVLEHRVLEEMTARLDPAAVEVSLGRLLVNTGAVAIGPGVGLDPRARAMVDHLVLQHRGPVVVDADALTHFAGRLEQLRGAAGPRLLTPHAGEMGRLLGCTAAEVEADRFAAATRCAEQARATVLLKGPATIVADVGAPPLVSRAGTAALATGGAGDVLTGICLALACHLPLRLAAIVGAHIHGLAAERWAIRGGDRGLLAREVADSLPEVLAGLTADHQLLTF